ncbi:unnamed protein product [Arctia plantaginis]|uniref:Inhibitor of growth protein n=1 Tax=Arctia plantaginis TaxID=874455 RepID=A0A8S1B5W7_ARCPL|nr:unnamed protein product [Arctia plantaginis]CAB3253292.1 unnamed protein product [Arctia plantaginis]
MLYLEDYLEMIEHLPQELRDRFTELREMDLSVQNNIDTLEKRVRTLFGGCRRGEINTDQANTEFADIKRGYNKTIEEADEKMALANQMYDLVDRYLRRLDTELHKFKCELEADNKGITELLEKRSLELDTNTNHTGTSSSSHYKDNSRYRIRAEKRRNSWNNRESRGQTSGNLSRTDSAIQAALGRDSYSLGHAGSAIAAAASQAIAATQQMQHGRRTASLKASYEAVQGGDLAHHALQAHHTHHEHGHGMAAGHSQTNNVHGHHTTSHSHNSSSSSSNKRTKQKKSNSYSSSAVSSHTQAVASAAASRSSSPTVVAMNNVATNNVAVEEPMEEEWTYDPNEPRYCVCNQVSYGDMVACDNQDCPFEWFHYPCVGITAPPKGKWYCPQCQSNMRRNRTHRKN